LKVKGEEKNQVNVPTNSGGQRKKRRNWFES
jgi:hypothetical protein